MADKRNKRYSSLVTAQRDSPSRARVSDESSTDDVYTVYKILSVEVGLLCLRVRHVPAKQSVRRSAAVSVAID